MNSSVDLQGLAIDRGGTSASGVKRKPHVWSRYVLPLVLILGFLSLVIWASWEMMFPPRPVTVIPVIATTADVQQEGTPLFNAAGWIEPRPTPERVAALAPGVVEELLVVEDQPVKKGEPVAHLVKDDAKLAYDRTVADLKLRQAELEEAKSALKAAVTRLEQPVHLEAAFCASQASLAKIQTELKNLPFQLKRAIADEPTGDLDPDTSDQILELLKQLNQQLDVTLLMVTHDAEAARIAERQYRLDHGKLVQTGGAAAAVFEPAPVS